MATTLQKRIAVESINPLRRPDWRWRLGLQLLNEGRRPASEDDPVIRQALAFARACLRRAPGLPQRPEGSAALCWREVSRAFPIYQSAGVIRSEIEARLLAGDPLETISARTGESIPVVKFYEALFFNVSGALDAHDWILIEAIIADAPGRGEPTREQTWKCIGYFGGAFLLDVLIAEDLGRAEPELPDRPLLAEMARQLARGFFLPLDSRTSYKYLRHLRAIRRDLKLPRKWPEEAIIKITMDSLRIAGSKPTRRRRAQHRRPTDNFPIREEWLSHFQHNRYTPPDPRKLASELPGEVIRSPSPQTPSKGKGYIRPAAMETGEFPRRMRANRLRAA